ncbi:MAG: acyltransferase [Parasporobacterium sp.]|nr:acyltransferase [Parasporobacterium sp.]
MNNRIRYIDGIRGLAVLFVTFCHFSSMFLPVVKDAYNATGMIFNNTPLTIVIYGNPSVQCFFLLSGFLIASNMYNKKQACFSPLTTYKKLLRFIIPAVVLVAILMALGLTYHIKAADLYPDLSYAYYYNDFTPTIGSMIKDIFYSTFFKCESIYIPPFWTMGYEFVGTIFITIMTFFLNHNKRNSFVFYAFACIIILFMFPDDYIAFTLGALLFTVQSTLEEAPEDSRLRRFADKFLLKPPVLILLLLAGIYPSGLSVLSENTADISMRSTGRSLFPSDVECFFCSQEGFRDGCFFH